MQKYTYDYLIKKLQETQEQNQRLREERDHLQHSISDLFWSSDEENSKLKERIEILENTIEELYSAVENLQNQIARYEQKSNPLKENIIKDAHSENWQDIFCKNNHGQNQDFYVEEDTIRKFAEDGGAFGGFHSRSDYERILKQTISDYADSIIKFIEGKAPIRTIVAEYPESVGYMICNNEKINVKSVELVLLKDKEDVSKYGFLISNFTPCQSREQK